MGDVDRILDTALLLRAQAGDSTALEELIVRHDGSLRYFVRRLVNDSTAADDIVQEVWLAALRQMKDIRSGAALRVWLKRVARNLAVSHLRSATVRKVSPLEDAEEVPAEEEFSFPVEDAAVIHGALAALNLEHREVLTLRFMDDMTYEEIATVIQCSVGTVRSRLHYAKKRLWQILQEKGRNIDAGESQSTEGVAQ
jgi:RNA polymerase sigma-70 factor, ECF subfamily